MKEAFTADYQQPLILTRREFEKILRAAKVWKFKLKNNTIKLMHDCTYIGVDSGGETGAEKTERRGL